MAPRYSCHLGQHAECRRRESPSSDSDSDRRVIQLGDVALVRLLHIAVHLKTSLYDIFRCKDATGGHSDECHGAGRGRRGDDLKQLKMGTICYNIPHLW